MSDPLVAHLIRLFRWEVWANRRVLRRLQEIGSPSEDLVRRFDHIQAGIELWLLRLDGEDSNHLDVWPERGLGELPGVVARNEAGLERLETKLTPEFLATEIHYENQHDLAYDTAASDLLLHLSSHGAYHRGQIASKMRELGFEPVNTDYVTYVRELAGQSWVP